MKSPDMEVEEFAHRFCEGHLQIHITVHRTHVELIAECDTCDFHEIEEVDY